MSPSARPPLPADAKVLTDAELAPDQKETLQRMLDVFRRIVDEQALSSTARPGGGLRALGARPDAQRTGRVLLIDGGRGTAKTTLLLTFLDAWAKRCAPGEKAPAWAQEGERGAALGNLFCLKPLDFDPMPAHLPLIAWIFQHLAKLAKGVVELPGACTTLRERHSRAEAPRRLDERWTRLVEHAIQGWEKPGEGRTYGERTEAERVRLQAWSSLLDELHGALDDLVAALEAQPCGACAPALIVLPIDDADLQLGRSAELVHALQLLWHPRLVFLVTGDRELLKAVVAADVAGEYRKMRHAPALDDMPAKLTDLPELRVQKAIPEWGRLKTRRLNLRLVRDHLLKRWEGQAWANVLRKAWTDGAIDQIYNVTEPPDLQSDAWTMTWRDLRDLEEQLQRGDFRVDDRFVGEGVFERVLYAGGTKALQKAGLSTSPGAVPLRRQIARLLEGDAGYLSLRWRRWDTLPQVDTRVIEVAMEVGVGFKAPAHAPLFPALALLREDPAASRESVSGDLVLRGLEELALVRARSAGDGAQRPPEALRWPAFDGLAAVVSGPLMWERAVSEAVLQPLNAAIAEARRERDGAFADHVGLRLALAYGELHQKLDEASKGVVDSKTVVSALRPRDVRPESDQAQRSGPDLNASFTRTGEELHPVVQLLLYPGFGLSPLARERLLAELVSGQGDQANDTDRRIEQGVQPPEMTARPPGLSTDWIIFALHKQHGSAVLEDALQHAMSTERGMTDPWPIAVARGRFGAGGWAVQRFLWGETGNLAGVLPKVHAVDAATQSELPFRVLLVPRMTENYTGLFEPERPLATSTLASAIGSALWSARGPTAERWRELTLWPTQTMNAAEWFVQAWELARRDANLAGLPRLRTSIDGIRVVSDISFRLSLQITPLSPDSTTENLRPSQNLRRLQWVSHYEAKQGDEPLKGTAGATEAQQRLFAAILWGVAALQQTQSPFLAINSAPNAESLGPPFSELTRLWPADMSPLAIEWIRALAPLVMAEVAAPTTSPMVMGQVLARWVALVAHLATQPHDPTFLLMPTKGMSEAAMVNFAVQRANQHRGSAVQRWIRENKQPLRTHLPSLPWDTLIPDGP
jgi:hypothetical protein